MDSRSNPKAKRWQQTSQREQQVIKLLLQGYHDAEIAKEVGIPIRTVKGYMQRMFVRYGIKSGIKRVKLAVMLYRKETHNATS